MNAITRISILATTAFLTAATAAPAQDYPNRAIRIVTPTNPGGVSDGMSRLVAQGLADRMNKQVVVENRAGAMTMIGNETVSRAAPDGYTILWGSVDMTMLPLLQKAAVNFDPSRDLLPVGMAVSTWGTYTVNPKVPVKSVPELVAYAKANPGKIRYGTNGAGGSLHLAVRLLEIKTGINLEHVPYKGIAQVGSDLVAGEIEMASMAISTAYANREKVRILAQTGPTRHAMLPDVPTTAEIGMPEVGVVYWFGLFAPPNTPQPIVDRLARELDGALKEPTMRERLFTFGADPSYMAPAAFAARVEEDKKKWAQLIPAMGIQPE
jgi:tripartite-type tricarboxylate transporter receptor subunit TctC